MIFKNIILLFTRTLFNLGLSLYISRRLLLVLGESDFGIYSVVGSIAVLFSFLESAIFSGAQRFLALSIKEDTESYQKCFATCMNTYMALAGVIFFLSETIGVYIINNVLSVPYDRLSAANWIFQFSIFSVLLTLTNGPYKASIIVLERLDYYAKIDVVVKVLQLALVVLLAFARWDKLIFYAFGMFLLSLLRFFTDKFFCIKNLRGCKYIRYFNKQTFRELLSFSGWTIFKSTSESMVTQGNNILVNIYGGTIASASMGLANQVWGAVATLINNIHLAFTSQIIQNWGLQKSNRFYQLINDSMRYSLYILSLIGIPFLSHTPYFLQLWLSNVPEYAVVFCRLSFISSILYSLISPLNTGVQAVGRIKRFQLIGSLILVLDLPLAFLLMECRLWLYCVLMVRIVMQCALLLFNSIYLSHHTAFPYRQYLKIIFKIILFNIIAVGLCLLLNYSLGLGQHIAVILSSITGMAVLILLIWAFSLGKYEKIKIRSIVHKIMRFNK